MSCSCASLYILGGVGERHVQSRRIPVRTGWQQWCVSSHIQELRFAAGAADVEGICM